MKATHPDPGHQGLVLWNLGFRPFFLGAGLFSVIGIAAWLLVYSGRAELYPQGIAITLWHGHEMLFGFVFAVIAGFLLTAVRNWTGLQTPHRGPLAVLFGLWAIARLSNHLSAMPLVIGATADLLFNFAVVVAVSVPIVRTRQTRQAAIIGKLVLLAVLNGLFYLDAFGLFDNGAWWAVYGAFYTIVALILMMVRRLIPFFVEAGVGYNVTLRNSKWLDITSLVLFIELMISELFSVWAGPTKWVAAALFLIHGKRLINWYTPGIWKKPLLWSLYLAYAVMAAGFLLFALTGLPGMPKILVLHAFAIGGVGVITLSMMSRVSLGHTGRSIHEPSWLVSVAIGLLAVATLVRIAGPVFDAAHYMRWVGISGGAWILAFALFSIVYVPILLSPRVDGRYS